MNVLLIVDDMAENKWDKNWIVESLEGSENKWSVELYQPSSKVSKDEIIYKIMKLNPLIVVIDQHIDQIKGSDISIEIRNKDYKGMIIFDSIDKSYSHAMNLVDGQELNQSNRYEHLIELCNRSLIYRCSVKLPIIIVKSYLIALSILCQGYLTAHWEDIGNDNKDNLSGLRTWDTLDDNIKNTVKSNKRKTEGQDWWKPAFEDVFEKSGDKNAMKQNAEFERTSICNELKSIGKECKEIGAIEALFNVIKEVNGQKLDTEAVIAAYSCIKELL